jgi:hypothetical protein
VTTTRSGPTRDRNSSLCPGRARPLPHVHMLGATLGARCRPGVATGGGTARAHVWRGFRVRPTVGDRAVVEDGERNPSWLLKKA